MNWFRVLQVAVALGLLVFVHELGHFLAAKWAGVRVEVFSLGFGPFIFSFRGGETVYAVSLIPLGGYVRMTGQVDMGSVKEEEKRIPHSYLAKSPAKRSVIIFAGVTMNLIFAYFVFAAAHMLGIIDVPAVVGGVQPGSPAEEAKLAKGDRIIEIDGHPVRRFTDLYITIATSKPGTPLKLRVRRKDGTEREIVAVPRRDPEHNLVTLGIAPPKKTLRLHMGARLAPGLGVELVVKDSPAEGVGLRKWDYIETVDGRPFEKLKGFKAALRRAGGGMVALGVRRGEELLSMTVTPERSETDAGSVDYTVGFLPSRLGVVGDIDESSAAYEAGLRPLAFVTEVIGLPDEDRFEIAWRNPDGSSGHAVLHDTGEGPEFVTLTRLREILPGGGFLSAWPAAVRECVDSVRKTFRVLYGLLSTRVSTKQMAGPIGIMQATYYSTKSGLGYYLWLVAFISVNLAVLNMFPMMPFDGGLLAFLFYEAVRGRPASQRVQEVAQIVGFILILALVIIVTKNDILRFI